MSLRKWTGSEQNYKELHHCLLIILKEIHRICERHNIKYFLSDGTLLGAVRHKGFIPWDDDADVGMIREDFEKFVAVCKGELSEKFILDDRNNFKVGLADTVVQSNTPGESFNISVDIFPYDNIPDNAILRSLYCKICIFFKKAKIIKNKIHLNFTNSFQDFIYRSLLMTVVYLFSAKQIAKILNNFLSSCRKSEKKDMAKVLGSSYLFELDINPAYMYKDVVLVPFEDTEFYILKNYDSVLSHMYGDYMTPPPETATEDDGTPSFLTRVAHPMEAYDPGSWLENSENSKG